MVRGGAVQPEIEEDREAIEQAGLRVDYDPEELTRPVGLTPEEA